MTKANTARATNAPTKLDKLIALLKRPKGADLPQLMAATGWQAHSVRGALAGSIKSKGWQIDSEKVAGRRIYKITGQNAE